MKGDKSAFPVLTVTTGEDLGYENQVPISVKVWNVQVRTLDGRRKERSGHVLLEGEMIDTKCQIHLEDGRIQMGKEFDM